MADAPLELTEDDFTSEPPPPGFLSKKLKDRYLPLMITLAFAAFVAQVAVPVVVMAVAMQPAMNPARQGQPQYAKFAAWQEALWYPTISLFGGSQGRSRLAAMDYEGKPLDRPPISLDMQPEWLLADGDTLWAVSNNEVGEIMSDGSTPIIMRPERYLLNPSRPFLHEGQLSIFDRDEDAPFHWYVFTDGEWKDRGELLIPGEKDRDAPADALRPEQAAPPYMRKTYPMAAGVVIDESGVQLAAVQTPDGLSLFAELHGYEIYHRQGIPLKTLDSPPAQLSEWEQIDGAQGGEIRAAVVAGQPAVIITTANTRHWNVWRKSESGWSKLPFSGTGDQGAYFSDIGVATPPGGERTLMIVEEYGGFGSPLWELQSDGMKQVATLGSPFRGNNPFGDVEMFQDWRISAVMWVILGLQILLITWLMRTHRDPYYYKGAMKVAYASVLRRVIAAVIDMLIVYGPIWLAWRYLLPEYNDPQELVKNLETNPELFLREIVGPLGYTAAWVVFCALVMWLMLGFWGFSPGKLICGVRVASTNLDRPGLLRALVRTIIWPFESFFMNGIGAFILIAFTPHWQRLADLVGGMVVVKANSLRQARYGATH